MNYGMTEGSKLTPLEMMQETHMVIDLETVDKKPTAGILSIGATTFIPHQILMGSEPQLSDFYINIDIESCINEGMTFSWDTIMWWLKQSAKAGEALQNDRLDISQALYKLNTFYAINPPSYVWGNPNKFDISILENAYDLCLIVPRWHFKSIMDLVTLENIIGPKIKSDIKKEIPDIDGVKHDALYDAKVEVYRISKALGKLSCLE